MPVYKFRTIDELPPPAAADSPSENMRVAVELSAVCIRLAGGTAVRGIRRYRGAGLDETAGSTVRVAASTSSVAGTPTGTAS
jgi:hypothetical protein